jgi:hypothetical protein
MLPVKRTYTFQFESDKTMQVGEELTYEVSYSLLKLGKVVLKIKDKKTINGRNYYTTVLILILTAEYHLLICIRYMKAGLIPVCILNISEVWLNMKIILILLNIIFDYKKSLK